MQFRVTPEEEEAILRNSEACKMDCSDYLRTLGTGFIPASKLDQESIKDLCKAAGDLGRLGGLLKLWITEKRDREQPARDTISVQDIDSLWKDIQLSYQQLKARIPKL